MRALEANFGVFETLGTLGLLPLLPLPAWQFDFADADAGAAETAAAAADAADAASASDAQRRRFFAPRISWAPFRNIPAPASLAMGHRLSAPSQGRQRWRSLRHGPAVRHPARAPARQRVPTPNLEDTDE